MNVKNILGYVAVGVTGYFIGFYEMKYKTLKTLLNVALEKEKEEEESNQDSFFFVFYSRLDKTITQVTVKQFIFVM